jgi:hypothetical protein
VLAGPVASRRRQFIWRHGEREGIAKSVFEKRWEKSKNGYPTRCDGHFDQFGEWWNDTYPAAELSPANIRPGVLAEHLGLQSDAGVHHDALRDMSTSISMACATASDKKHQPGAAFSVKEFVDGERRRRPMRRKNNGVYKDVALLFQETWLCGPDSAMALGHKKERVILLMFADTACRPSDLWRLYRACEGWRQHIVFVPGGVKVRFFYPKEVVLGSSRDNATGYYFSAWVMTHDTEPASISTPRCLRVFLDGSSGPEFATKHVPELDCDVQPLCWASFQQSKWWPSSIDTISKVTKNSLLHAGMGEMISRSIRGASPSKIVQLYPELLPEALKLGRWTTRKAFNNHYQGPVELAISDHPSPAIRNNSQQILRWGFTPRPPEKVSALDYMKGPDFWVGTRVRGRHIKRAVQVVSFDKETGRYKAKQGTADRFLFHYELMTAISEARS